ncbi:MAG: DUF2620 domain-containing protein [Firmicutes bacterium HGW-Firmicutes-7]|nr:MAG: DUF2620 domain-containing protein [Firmicutes bacterium HGW-Firmicutes-7]
MRIAVGGLDKRRIKEAVKRFDIDHVEVYETTDIVAARDIKKGETEYYFGACNSGGGAAISILIGMVGYNKCCTVARNGQKANEEEIVKYLKEGKICFGMSVENIEATVELLMKHIVNQN